MDSSIDDFYTRSLRPQAPNLPSPTKTALTPAKVHSIPTAAALLRRYGSKATDKHQVLVKSPRSHRVMHHELSSTQLSECSPWISNRRLGELIQADARLIVATFLGKLVMFKKLSKSAGEKARENQQRFSHPNIVTLKQAFLHEDAIYLGFEYYRFTAEEVLSVHLPLDEPMIRAIARSVGRTLFS